MDNKPGQSPAVSVKDIMTKSIDVISVFPETPLIEAAQLISKHNFDGIPVVDRDNKLMGLLTEYDLISKSTSIHLPTFQLILKNLQVFRTNQSQFRKEIDMLSSLKVGDVMNNEPLTLADTATYEKALSAFIEHHRVNPIPVVNNSFRVVGVISRYDILKPMQYIQSSLQKNTAFDGNKAVADNLVHRPLELLRKEYILVGKTSFNLFYVVFAAGIFAGLLLGFILTNIF